MLFLSAPDRELHFNPVKALVVKESAVFHLPDALQKILWNLVKRDPAIMNFALVLTACESFNSTKKHEAGDRWVKESDIDDLKGGNYDNCNDEYEKDAEPGK